MSKDVTRQIPQPRRPLDITLDESFEHECILLVHGWQGKKPAPGFEYAARTQADEKTPSIVREAVTKRDFMDLFAQIRSLYTIKEFHMFSHSGAMDGPQFQGDQPGENELSAGDVHELARLRWTSDATAYFHGCHSAYGWFPTAFATTQKVVVYGSPGFTMFSKKADAFEPWDDALPTKPCYQACFRGATQIAFDAFGIPSNVVMFGLQYLASLPLAMIERLRAAPPLPMIRIAPKDPVRMFK